MYQIYKFVFLLLLISGCTKNIDQSFQASSLIKPNFDFSNHLIPCNLKKDANLLSLENFFSNLVKDRFYYENNFDLLIYFPKTSYVNKFIINIQNNSIEDIYSTIIKDLSLKGFDEIAYCNFNSNKLEGLILLNYQNTDKVSFNTTEILYCNYNASYNYGTFSVAIDRFLNQMSSLNIPYSVLYLQDNTSPDSFIWINNFYNEDYSQEITDRWINTTEAKEIKDEFLENAECIESDIYNAFIIN